MNADDLLRRAREYLPDCSEMAKDIDEYLAAPKDEPVAIIEEDDYGCFGEILSDKSVRLGQFLYLHPPTKIAPREAMTEDEILHSIGRPHSIYTLEVFRDGIRAAERHHGIGGGE
jgi:hypothetical protein